MTMTTAGLGTLVTYNPTVVATNSTLLDIQRLMDESLIHHLPVVDAQRRPIGIVSDLDVAKAVLNEDSAAPDIEAIMVRDLVVVDINDSPHDALQLMLSRHIHSLPVLDGERLVGIVTSTDFLREFSYGEMRAYRDPVADHLTTELTRIDASAMLDEALQLVQASATELVPVTKGDCPVGVVSLRGLRRAMQRLAPAQDTAKMPIARLLDNSSARVHPGEKLGNAAGQMLDGKVKALMVSDRRNELLGLLTEDNILRAVVRELELGTT